MRALKSIETFNIQSHKHVLIELPEKGLIRFYGDNSDGKSVIVKAIWRSVNGDIYSKKHRRALINRDGEEGRYILKTYEDYTLDVHLHVESSKTYFYFSKGEEEPIMRYLSDKQLQQALLTMGFHYSEKREFSLNIYNTYDPMLFSGTSPVVNYDALESAAVDIQAEKAVKNLEVLAKDTKSRIESIEKAIKLNESVLATLNVYDIEKESDIKNSLTELKSTILSLREVNLPVIEDTVDIELIESLNAFNIFETLNNLKSPNMIILEQIELLTVTKLTDVRELLAQLLEIEYAIENETCSLCGRRLKDDVC